MTDITVKLTEVEARALYVNLSVILNDVDWSESRREVNALDRVAHKVHVELLHQEMLRD